MSKDWRPPAWSNLPGHRKVSSGRERPPTAEQLEADQRELRRRQDGAARISGPPPSSAAPPLDPADHEDEDLSAYGDDDEEYPR